MNLKNSFEDQRVMRGVNFNDVINNTLADACGDAYERSHILVKVELLAQMLAALIEAVELPTKTKLEIA